MPPLKLWFNWHFEGVERVPAEGPLILASNHLSYFDAFALTYFVLDCGRRPRFLAKSELFKNFFLRTILHGAGQIPVERGTGDPAPLAHAARELAQGEVVVVFPEGTTNQRPDFSLQPAKTGTARLSLTSGVPVTPMAIWGPHKVWKHGNIVPAFARPMWVKIGEPLDFPEHAGSEDSNTLRMVTDETMSAIGTLLEEVKSDYPERWQ
jgi:1-acyl-sn-glycerol-3-phosphate acyltransferase